MSQDRLIPAQSIPIDVLHVVFEMLRDTCASERGLFKNLLGPKSTLSLRWIPETTHVCRSWRQVALSTNLLWTNIDVTASTPWAFEFACRSGNAPICIFVSDGADRDDSNIYALKTLLHDNRQRIRKMSMTFENLAEELFPELSGKTGTGPPFYAILEDLKISFRYTNHTSPFVLADDMLCAPELKRLSLTNCFVATNFGSLHNLSYLCISNTFSISPMLSPNGLHSVLLRTPNLETLALDADFTLISKLAIDPRVQPVVLLKLRHIVIWGLEVEWVSGILRAISCGRQRHLFVNAQLSGLEQILSLLSSASHAKDSFEIRQLLLSTIPSSTIPFFYSTGFRLFIWRGEFPKPDIDPELSEADIALAFSTQLVRPDLNLLNGLLCRMDYQGLQVLVLDSREILPTRLWVELFGALPLLALIAMSPWGERELFGALIDEDEDGPAPLEPTRGTLSTGSDPAALPFQALREIRVDLRSELYSEEDMAFILKCLRKRLDIGMRLETLSFRLDAKHWVLLSSQVDIFKDVVGSMEISKVGCEYY